MASIKEDPPLEKVVAAFREIEADITKMLQEIALYADVVLSGRIVGGYMQNASKDSLLDPANPPPGPLKIRTGRLVSSAAGKGYLGEREFVVDLSINKGLLKWVKTFLVPYAGIHEYGGSFSIPVTERMRRFFWAMYYKTGEDKWRGMALTKKTSFKITIRPRPYAEPAFEDVTPAVTAKAESLLFTLINQKLEEATR